MDIGVLPTSTKGRDNIGKEVGKMNHSFNQLELYPKKEDTHMKFGIALIRRTQRFTVIVACWIGLALCLFSPALSGAVVEGIPCTPEPTDMIVAYGDLVTCSIDPVGDTDIYRFSGTSGETVVIQGTWQSGSMRPCIELVAPDNSRLKTCANSFSNRIDTTINQTGTYTILFSDVFSTGTGNYALALERVIPPSPTAQLIQYGETLNDEINPIGDVDIYFFNGTVGDTITVQGVWQSGSMRPCVELVAPDNSRLKACANSFSNSIDTTLNQTGTYTVLFTDVFSTGTGNYALVLQCLIGTCAIVPVPDISGCIYLQGQPLPNRKVTLRQPRVVNKTTTTDTDGCYEFENAVSGKRFNMIISGPIVP
jgi:hypothetical protein